MSNTIRRINNVVYGAKRDIKIDQRGLGRYIFDKMKENGTKIFQVNGIDGAEESYDFVNEKAIRVSLEMRKRGVKANDIILLCTLNTMDSFVPVLSTVYLNAATVTLDPSISLRDSTHLLNIIRPRMIFVQEASTDLIEATLKDATYETEIIVMGEHSKYSTYAEFLKPHPEEKTFIPDNVKDIKDTSVIFFSSGTTGLPKAIEHSNYSLLYIMEGIRDLGVEHKTILFFTSTYWLSAILLSFTAINRGTRRVVVKGFHPEESLKVMNDRKITYIFSAPSLTYKMTDDLIKKYPCPELKSLLLGGSGISPEQMKKARNYFPNCMISLCYALTESGGLVTCFSAKNFTKEFQDKCASSGQPVSNVAVKIVDLSTGELLGPNSKGEIRVKTPSACSGYYNQDSSGIFDEDGFIKTGDVGYFDEDNCLYVCDRIKDIFKYQSWHIVPQSIENVIATHPSVAEALIIGIPSEADGHIPMGLVVLREDAPIVAEDDLLKYTNENVLDREQLRAGLKIVKRLPKGSTGKVSRKQITDLVISGQLHTLL